MVEHSCDGRGCGEPVTSRSAVQFLSERIVRLDSESLIGAAPWQHAVAVMGSYTNTTPTQEIDELIIDPKEADDATARSVLLQRLSAEATGLVRGPIDRKRQIWMTTGRNAIETRTPSRRCFVEPRVTNSIVASYSTGGLFTSTAVMAGRSMWQMYLEPYEGSEMFPGPWAAWSMPVAASAVVAEIDSAEAWARFVQRYPRLVNGHIYPDWRSAAEDYDGVHLALAAVVAGQGWFLRPADGVATIAASYWDTECTFWFRWSFDEPALRQADVLAN